jgi:hypothetical protein
MFVFWQHALVPIYTCLRLVHFPFNLMVCQSLRSTQNPIRTNLRSHLKMRNPDGKGIPSWFFRCKFRSLNNDHSHISALWSKSFQWSCLLLFKETAMGSTIIQQYSRYMLGLYISSPFRIAYLWNNFGFFQHIKVKKLQLQAEHKSISSPPWISFVWGLDGNTKIESSNDVRAIGFHWRYNITLGFTFA